MGGPPPSLLPGEAYAGLMGAAPYDGADIPASMGSFDDTAVSLPSGAVPPVGLTVLLAPHGNQVVEQFCSRMVLPQAAAQERLKRLELRSCYCDPKLSQGQNWPKFVRRMASVGMIDFALSVDENVGGFFVKKDGRTEIAPHHRCEAQQLLV